MLPFDVAIKKKIDGCKGLYLRYSDDILMVIPKDKIDDMCTFAQEFLRKKLNLEINTKKTELTSFEEVDGFLSAQDVETGTPSHLSYLGITFDGSRFYLRHKAIARHQKRMRAGIKNSQMIAAVREQSIPKHFPKYLRPGGPNTWTYADRVASTLNSPEIRRQTQDKRLNKKIKSLA